MPASLGRQCGASTEGRVPRVPLIVFDDLSSQQPGARHLCRINVILSKRRKKPLNLLIEPTLKRTEVRAPTRPIYLTDASSSGIRNSIKE
jgi:hypothetical protein